MGLADGISFTAASTGTVDFVFSSSRGSFRTPAQAVTDGSLIDGQTVSYLAQDSAINPTQREWGHGTFTAASSTVARTTVLGTNAGGTSKVNFTAPPIVSLTGLSPDFRELLLANRTYYVRTDGSDSNNGLTNTAGGGFATWNKAIATLGSLDGNGFQVTIQGNNATHTDQLLFNKVMVGITRIIVDCAGGTINTTSNSAILFTTGYLGTFDIQNVTLQTTTSGNCIEFATGQVSLFRILSGVTFGAAVNSHIYIHGNGVFVNLVNAYSITGGATNHYQFFNCIGSAIIGGVAVTLSGTLTFSDHFANCNAACLLDNTNGSFTGGTITGTRYIAGFNGIINTTGGGASFYPGNAGGTTQTQGQYL